MNSDPGFVHQVDEVEGQARIVISSAKDQVIGEGSPLALEASCAEILALGCARDSLRSALVPGGDFHLVLNGWQSWSWAGERRPEEVQRPTPVKRMRLFSEGPAQPAARGEFLSYFYLGLVSGTDSLFVLSRNSGGAPLAFRITQDASRLQVELLASGASYAKGQAVAELRIFSASWPFGAKDCFAACFLDYRHFERLAFLGHEGGLVPGGYESWYNHYTHIYEALISADVAGLGEPGNLISDYYLARGKPTVFQVDDGWELRVGDWEAHPGNFPSGMRALCSTIEAGGYIPGLWVAPFLVTRSCAAYREHPEWILRDARGRKVLAGWNPNWSGDFWALDLSLPEVGDYLEALFERIVEDWGYRYLKLDFLYAAFLPGKRARGGAAFEHWERLIGRITSRISNRAGKPVAWLGCGAPLESSFRHFPLMRVGADTKEAWEFPALRLVGHEGRPAAYSNMLATIGRSILDGTVFVNDPDVVFCREKNNRLKVEEKELVALVDILLASQVMYSDGSAEVSEPAVRAFTSRLLDAADCLAGPDFGARRLERDVFAIESRDGRFRGVANLSNKAWRAPEGLPPGRPVVSHTEGPAGSESYSAHTISIYEV